VVEAEMKAVGPALGLTFFRGKEGAITWARVYPYQIPHGNKLIAFYSAGSMSE